MYERRIFLKKLLPSILLTTLISSLLLVGCGSNTPSTNAQSPSSQNTQSQGSSQSNSQSSYSTVIMGAQNPVDSFTKKFNLSGSHMIGAKESVILDDKKVNLDQSSMVIGLYSMDTPLDSRLSQIFPNADLKKTGITDLMKGSSHRILIIGKDGQDLSNMISSLDKDWYNKVNSKDMNNMPGMNNNNTTSNSNSTKNSNSSGNMGSMGGM